MHMLPQDENNEDEESLIHLNQRAKDLWMVTIEDGEDVITPSALLAHLYKISGAQFTCEELQFIEQHITEIPSTLQELVDAHNSQEPPIQPNYLFFAYFKELHLVRVNSIEEHEAQEAEDNGLKASIAEVDGESEQSQEQSQETK